MTGVTWGWGPPHEDPSARADDRILDAQVRAAHPELYAVHSSEEARLRGVATRLRIAILRGSLMARVAIEFPEDLVPACEFLDYPEVQAVCAAVDAHRAQEYLRESGRGPFAVYEPTEEEMTRCQTR